MTAHSPLLQLPHGVASSTGARTPDDARPNVPLMVGCWQVDRSAREITHGDRSRRLSPRAMELLLALAAAPGEVLNRADLMDRVWPGVHVGDESLTQAVAELRRALGKDAEGRGYIETVPKAGYRLIATVSTDCREADVASFPGKGSGDARDQVTGHLAITEARRLARNVGVLAVSEIDVLISEAIAAAPHAAHVQAEYAVQMVCAAVHAGDRLNRLTLASQAANDAARLRPDLLASQRALGFVQGMTGDMDGALRSFSTCLSIDPDDFETHFLAAKVCMSSGFLRQSIILGDRAAELDPDDYRPAFNAARAALKLGDVERAKERAALALRRIEAHLALAPSHRRYQSARAAASAMLGRCTDDPQTILKRSETRPILYDVIAFAHLGMLDLASCAFERLVQRGMTYAGWIQADPVADILGREHRFHAAFARMQAA